jgi:putative membrane protein
MKSSTATSTAILGLAAFVCSLSASAQTSFTLRDKTFLAGSTEGSMLEVALGKLAAEKSSNADIKAFGQKMVDDHSMLMDKMKPFAEQAGVAIPSQLSPSGKATLKRLSSLSGDAFNRAYLKDMVADHNKDLGAFISERDSTSNASLRTTVTAGTQVVREHTEMVDRIAKDAGIPTPPMPPLSNASIPPSSDQSAAQVEPVVSH